MPVPLRTTAPTRDGHVFDGGGDEDNASFADSRGYDVIARPGGTATDRARAGSCQPTTLLSSNESLEGSPGDDFLVGDVLRARDGAADRKLNCGKGRRRQSVVRDAVDPAPAKCRGPRRESKKRRSPRRR